MSIVIQNMGYTNDKKGKHDDCHYALRINHKTLTHFIHSRQEGLATCLRKAADAIDKGEMDTKDIPFKFLSQAEQKYINFGSSYDL